MFNVICVTRGWVGVQFPEEYRYVTHEWPLTQVFEVHFPFCIYTDSILCHYKKICDEVGRACRLNG